VHEGITTGLKGGRLLLDGDDLETIQDSLSNRALVSASQNFRSVSKMAAAPINLAVSISPDSLSYADEVARLPSDQSCIDWSGGKAP
jgi:hypothetical protein